MSEKRFVCIDVGYGDDWYITDNGKRLSDMEIVDLLNKQQATIERLERKLELKAEEVEYLKRMMVKWGMVKSEENGQLKKVNNLLYNENIQLRRILVNYKDLIYDVKYLEEKGVFDGEKDKKNIWDVEPVVEKHS